MRGLYYFSVVLAMLVALVALFRMGSGRASGIQESAAATAEIQIPEARPDPIRASMLFVGDIMVGRNVETLTNQHGDDYPFEKISDLISAADFAFANLEGPIVHAHSQTPAGSFVFSFKDTTGEVLARAGFDGVSLANNHTLNQAEDGFLETESTLDAAGLLHVGHPIEMSEDFVAHTTINTIPVTLAGFNMTFPYDDPDAAVATVAKLAAASAEPIIVMMHWGNEYQPHSDAMQEKLAHRFIDAGADLIIGAHPHVVEEVERYQGKLIFYSLGNFVFDQYFSAETQEELGVGIQLSADGIVSARLYPIQSVLSQPALMGEPARRAFLQALAERSSIDLQEAVVEGELN